ncbi:MAG: hypothetical protein AB8F95_14520 [Bacteroidia bacterium]
MKYFNQDELLALQAFEGKKLTGVAHVLWRNMKREAGGYEALDWIELSFTDASRLVLSSDDDSVGITLDQSFDFAKKETEISKQFGGQVLILRQDMEQEPPWIDAIDKTLVWIGLEAESEGLFLRESLRLDFGDWAIDIGLEEEGLKVDVGLE